MTDQNLPRCNWLAAAVAVVAAPKMAAANQDAPAAAAFGRSIPRQRHLGRLAVSSIGQGCQGLGQNMYGVPQPSRADAVRIVHQAWITALLFSIPPRLTVRLKASAYWAKHWRVCATTRKMPPNTAGILTSKPAGARAR